MIGPPFLLRTEHLHLLISTSVNSIDWLTNQLVIHYQSTELEFKAIALFANWIFYWLNHPLILNNQLIIYPHQSIAWPLNPTKLIPTSRFWFHQLTNNLILATQRLDPYCAKRPHVYMTSLIHPVYVNLHLSGVSTWATLG